MKILLLASNGGSGGLKGYIKGFISACGAVNEHEWFVICSTSFAEYIKDVCIENNVQMCIDDYTMGVKSILLGNRLPDSVIKIIEEINPDVIFHMNSVIHKGTEKYKNVVGFHNQLYIDTKQLKRQKNSKTRITLSVIRKFAIKSIKKADLVVFDSKSSLEQTISYGIYPKKSVVAYFGVEEIERKKEWSEKHISDPIKLLYISTLYPYKNQYELLIGINKLKQMGYNIHLDLVGAGPRKYEKKVSELIKDRSMGDYVTIHNWVEHNKIKDMISSSDIFVYASSIETSGFGLMEGMVQGAVIACNNESCMPEILNGGGVLFDVFSPDDIALKLRQLIDDSDLRNGLSKRAFTVSQEYVWENCVKTISTAIKELS